MRQCSLVKGKSGSGGKLRGIRAENGTLAPPQAAKAPTAVDDDGLAASPADVPGLSRRVVTIYDLILAWFLVYAIENFDLCYRSLRVSQQPRHPTDSSAAAPSPTDAGAGMAPSSSELMLALAPTAAGKSAAGAISASASFVAVAGALAAAAVVFLI
ncbi:hypothetical protein [Oryza sativa Japonica Group]|uniref:Uncharacterized protein n=1 Tax=Oryza sativa subsp. japonica TaxID=39947 RepID=Q5ZDP5_ORYSJ|nr:hypothetical protein [Oryza sativa Japonica Group]